MTLIHNPRMSPCESRNYMTSMREAAIKDRSPMQAIDLSVLVELEARWENMRKTPARAQEVGSVTPTLLEVQKAYDAFRTKLAAYNKRYTPAHVPELLLNTPARLAIWCRTMRELYLQVEHDPQAPCPLQLLEKAYRWADRMSVRMNKPRGTWFVPPGTIRAATEALGALLQWCDDLGSGVGPPATSEVITAPSGVPTGHADGT